MAKSPEAQMALMIDPIQPHCDEPIEAAMVCSHAGSTGRVLGSAIAGIGGGLGRTSELPNPVLIGVGATTVYAFKFKPRGTKMRVKDGWEAARWARSAVGIEDEAGGKMARFTMTVAGGGVYPFEVMTAFGGAELLERFLSTLRQPAA